MEVALLGTHSELSKSVIESLEKQNKINLKVFDLGMYSSRFIDFRDSEILIQNLDNIDISRFNLIINSISDEKSKAIILNAEDNKVPCIDLSNNFINDSSIPMYDMIDDSNLDENTWIVRIPQSLVIRSAPIIKIIDDNYKIKKLQITSYEKKLIKDIDEAEENITNDLSELSNYNGRLGISIISVDIDESFIHCNIEFQRPFNQDDLVHKLSDFPMSLHRSSRDLSVDSGINIWFSFKDDTNYTILALEKLINKF